MRTNPCVRRADAVECGAQLFALNVRECLLEYPAAIHVIQVIVLKLLFARRDRGHSLLPTPEKTLEAVPDNVRGVSTAGQILDESIHSLTRSLCNSCLYGPV